MSAAPDSAVQASTKLLRVVTALIAQVEPVKGGRAGAMQALAEEVKEVLKDNGGGLAEDARQLLETVVDTLSTVSTTLPYPFAISLVVKVSTAADLLLSSSPSTPPISLLPAELFSRIVHFCQDDDLRLRQQTNLALVQTSRSFYLAVRPLLSAEAHLRTAGQLVRLADKIEEDPEATRALRTVTMDFRTVDLAWDGEGKTWPGRRLLPFLESTTRLGLLETLRLTFDEGAGEDYFALPTVVGFNPEVSAFEDLFDTLDVPHLELPSLSVSTHDSGLRAVLDPPLRRRSIWIGKDAAPDSPNEHFESALSRTQAYKQTQNHNPLTYVFPETLAIPWITMRPSSLLALLSPSPAHPSTLPSLHHLEISFRIRDVSADNATLSSLFALLRPTLSYLTLRLIFPTGSLIDRQTLSMKLGQAVGACEKLQYLAIGGHIEAEVLSALPALADLEELVLLPIGEYVELDDFAQELGRVRWHMRTFTVCGVDFDGHSAELFRLATAVCEQGGAKCCAEGREKEVDWLTRFA